MDAVSSESPTVAVITRTKDRGIFLRRAIESVSAQTYTDFIHVIVNDGGDKNLTNSIIESYDEDVKSKIRLFHRDESSNAPDTIFNESIDRVSSKYFAIHDDDDTWHPNFLSETVAKLENDDNLAAVVVRTSKIEEEVSGGDIIQKKISPWMPDIKSISLYRQCIDNQFTPISTLFRRSFYESVGKFDDSLPVVGDWEFGVRLLLEYDAGFIDPGYALANYHHRKKNGTSHDSVSSHEMHRHYTNLIMNRHLRQEISQGRLGVGYIMSSLRYRQHERAEMLRRIMPKSIVSLLKNRVRN